MDGAIEMLSPQTHQPDPNIRTLESGGITWVNIEHPSETELEWLENQYGFHPMALEESPSHGEMSTIDDFDTYLAIAMFFPVFDHESRITLASEVNIFVGSDYLVMMHSGNLTPLVRLFQECESNSQKLADAAQGSPGYLLYSILDVLSDYCSTIVRRIDRNVDNIEFRVFDERAADLVKEISVVRRDIISYLRIVRHQVGVLDTLERKEYSFLNIDSEVYFGEIADNVRGIRAELEELKEVVEGLGDAHSTLITHQTNRIIRILTVMSAILLPLSVISGLYGMNVRLPMSDTPYAFGVVLAVMGVIAGTMLIFFRLRHWI